MARALSDVLAQVDDWEPDTVAVGVTDPDATIATHGPVDLVLPVASLTKPLAAYACLVAIQDGELHLDEPAGPPGTDAITVRHLLAHASGLPPDEDGPVSAPEQRRIYSNHGYDLLGALVADRVGRPFAEHLDLEVLQPLGMSDTSLDGSPAHAANSTVTNLLAFARELLDPTLLDADLHAVATTVAFPGLDGVLPGYGRQSPNDWGLGLEIRADKDPHWTGTRFAPSTFGHFGRSGSYLWIEPTRRLASASLADQDFGPWAVACWPPFGDAILEALS